MTVVHSKDEQLPMHIIQRANCIVEVDESNKTFKITKHRFEALNEDEEYPLSDIQKFLVL